MNKINDFLKQTKDIQQKIAALKGELEKREVEVSSDDGMVKIRITGKQEILDFDLNEKCIEHLDKEKLEQLIKGTVNKAIGESQNMVSLAMSKMGRFE